MAKDPAFLFYPGDFNTGTQFFSDEQVGKYMRLLMAQHQHGHLTQDQVIFICKSYDNQVMSKFVKDNAGLWYNERLEIEVSKRKKFVESRSKNKEGKTKTKIISESYDNHMENRDRNENRNENYITIGEEKIFDVMPILEFNGAALNARQKEHKLRSWKDMVPEWLRLNVQVDFNDERHIFNAFSKYIIDNGKPKGIPGTQKPKLTLADLEKP